VSSGRAAQLLGKEREEFIGDASENGIPYFQLGSDELQREIDTVSARPSGFSNPGRRP
jgi:hypothetical protein